MSSHSAWAGVFLHLDGSAVFAAVSGLLSAVSLDSPGSANVAALEAFAAAMSSGRLSGSERAGLAVQCQVKVLSPVELSCLELSSEEKGLVSHVVAALALCCREDPALLLQKLAHIQTEFAAPSPKTPFYLALLIVLLEDSDTNSHIPSDSIAALVVETIKILLSPKHADLHPKITATLLPLFLNHCHIDPPVLCTEIWARILSSLPDSNEPPSPQLLRTASAILVHLFPHFFGLDAKPVSASRKITQHNEGAPKRGRGAKFNRKDAKSGITGEGAISIDESIPHDAIDWSNTTSSASPTLDLRSDPSFWRVLQSGLVCHQDAVVEKYCLLLMKRVVDVSAKFGCVNGTEVFAWPVNETELNSKLWADYFVVLEILKESAGHLVEPILPKLASFLSPNGMHSSWWILLMTRGLHNNTGTMRKKMLEYLISWRGDVDATSPEYASQRKRLDTLCGPVGSTFLYGMVLPRLDAAHLYNVSGLGTYVSPFVAEGRGIPLLGFDEVSKLEALLGSDRAVSVWTKPDARTLFCYLSLTILLHLSIPSVFTFPQLSTLLHTLGPKSRTAPLFLESQLWCAHAFAPLPPYEWLVQEIQAALANYLSDSTPPASTQSHTASTIAHMLQYLPPAKIATAIDPLLSRLLNLHSASSYAPPGTCTRVMKLLAALPLDVFLSIPFTSSHLEEIVTLTMHTLMHPTPGLPFDALTLHAAVLHRALPALSQSETKLFHASPAVGHLSTLYQLAWSCFTSETGRTQTTLFAAYTSLTVVFKVVKELNLRTPVSDVSAPPLPFLLTSPEWVKVLPSGRGQQDSRVNWSLVQNSLQTIQYECLLAYLSSTRDHHNVLNSLATSISTTSSSSAPFLFNCVREALSLPSTTDTVATETIRTLLQESLAIVLDHTAEAKSFMTLLHAFGQLCCCPALLSSQDPVLIETITSSIITCLELGQNRMHVVQAVADPCLEFWSSGGETETAVESLEAFRGVLVRFCGFGPLREKNVDADRGDAVVAYMLEKEVRRGEEWIEKEGTAELNFNCQDYLVRVRANAVLVKLDPSVLKQRDLAVRMLKELMALTTSGVYRAKFDSTIEHRIQIRTWCSIHLLLDHIVEAEDWGERFVEALDVDLVISTRYYVEWAAMRVMIRHPEAIDSVWSWLDRFETKSTTICSLFTILLHVLPRVPAQLQPPLFETLFSKITPWLTSNHFTIRLFAQYTAINLFETRPPSVHPSVTVKSLIHFIQTNADCAKHRAHLDTLFFISAKGFEPIADVSMEFVFHVGLAAAGVTPEERISAHAFERIGCVGSQGVPLFHAASRRAVWRAATSEGGGGLPMEFSDPAESIKQQLTNQTTTTEMALQRKIEPWETMLATDFDFSGPQQRDITTRRTRFPLIVVASLVSKSPNLGGLCRTCEIFNAELLTVPSLKVKTDPAFLVTSVTAEKWMPMMELPASPAAILPFLLSKKQQGYSILAIEQATNSVSLDTFEFPEKCVLLLGMEKLGVPAVYLPLVDFVIEIPQYGVIRSLNVHVSGALVVYSFARQQQMQQK
ncbi:Tar (HIV-1) RNA binding protein 1 [Podochytrium sp. JEL0797]|nr:Tar (HIV-1) RNA binding protein 1 [Podochytrium sp. JEL0797]